MLVVERDERPLERPLRMPELAALERELRGNDPVVQGRHDDRNAAVVDNTFAEQEVLLGAVGPDGAPGP